MIWSIIAQSRAVFAIGPMWSRLYPSATQPALLTRPNVCFMPLIPQYDAGPRIEQPVSVPRPPRIRSVINSDTLRLSTERTTLVLPAFAVSFNSGLKSIRGPFHPRLPAAPQRLIEADDCLQPRELRLHQGIFSLK